MVKKYFIFLLPIMFDLQGMEKYITSCREENLVQQEIALDAFDATKLTFKDKRILQIGCGPIIPLGNLTETISHQALKITGIDSRPSIIELAREKHSTNTKISFKCNKIENISKKNHYDLALLLFSIQWIEDKSKALKAIQESLTKNGEIFIITTSGSDPEPIDLAAAKDMFPNVQKAVSVLKSMNLLQAIGSSYPTHEEFTNILTQNGFDAIQITQHVYNYKFASREDVEKFERPIVMSTPSAQYVPDTLIEIFFGQHIDRIMEKLIQSDDGNYVWPFTHTIIKAKKS